jgi:hypothetical protein
MIGEFLKAELYSSRFSKGSYRALEKLGYKPDIINRPNYSSAIQNNKRSKTLGLTRGWPNEWLFTRFPNDIAWYSATISQVELGNVYRLKSTITMPEPDRLLYATAKKFNNKQTIDNVDPNVINQIINKAKKPEVLPPIIMVAKDFTSKRVLIEGHSRSIALCSINKKDILFDIKIIIGISNNIATWEYF